ncbi:hypothetical protein KFE25_000204 [Diacronema lutheri]|uniref:Uncharacterized protein n=1 Tax=Diacronema lutheri TaxID=2081491 RepID=A0A8J5X970_DIALT|nr:hypothetical protein KFE25_000204 [Diacronema lutheri]
MDELTACLAADPDNQAMLAQLLTAYQAEERREAIAAADEELSSATAAYIAAIGARDCARIFEAVKRMKAAKAAKVTLEPSVDVTAPQSSCATVLTAGTSPSAGVDTPFSFNLPCAEADPAYERAEAPRSTMACLLHCGGVG